MTTITFSSCFYIIKSKFDPNIYIEWMNHFISIVNQFKLVIYTDEKSVSFIDIKNNPNIKVVIKPLESFYLYKYKEYWIKNHAINFLLNEKIDWKVNMLWSEKLWFVNETIKNNYFDSKWYGWCDIGYFRNRQDDLNTMFLSTWPNPNKILSLNQDKIYYGCINNDVSYINYLRKIINNKNALGLPKNEIPCYQKSISGGFFIVHPNKIEWWIKTYETKLEDYFKNNYLVKDDQIILADCIFSEQDHFVLFRENNKLYDNWFMFQRILN
jgi:hypothetical protein